MNHRASAPPLLGRGLVAMALCAGLSPLLETFAMACGSDLDAALEVWRAEYGSSWELNVDEKIGFGELLYGGEVLPANPPEDDAGFVETAIAFVQASEPLHGIGAETLVFDRVVFLPLSLIDSTDKTTVRFTQQIDGVPVEGGYVNVLMDTAEGYLLSVQNTALPGLESFDTTSTISADEAIVLAREQLRTDTGISTDDISDPELVITQIEDEMTRTGLLAWRVQASAWLEEQRVEPVSAVYLFDARSADLIRSTDAIARYNVSGVVQSKVTLDTQALYVGSDEDTKPMGRIHVYDATGQSILATTLADGTFTITGYNAPLDVKLRYEGVASPRIQNDAGSEQEESFHLLTGTGNTLVMNDSPVDAVTAQANAYYWITSMREWILATNPADGVWGLFSPGKPETHVNIDVGGCEAFGVNETLSFFSPDACAACSGQCSNKANATIIAHETGHLLTEKYMGSRDYAFDEGNADVFALYLTDQLAFGENWCLDQPSCITRRGDNARRYCPNGLGNCYGEFDTHENGEVLMAAFWKMRERMKQTQGAYGGHVADVLHNAWMNAYNEYYISADIRTHLLLLDDGVLPGGPMGVGFLNGTPHWADIDLGFADQGFPRHGIIKNGIVFSNVTGPDVVSETGPYTVTANIVANFAAPIQYAKLHYRVNGASSFTQVTMTNTSGSSYSGSIPGQDSPSLIEYYLTAKDSMAAGVNQTGQTVEYPVSIKVSMDGTYDQDYAHYDKSEATPIYRRTLVGQKVQHFFDNLEAPPNGWSHGGAGDDWQTGVPQGMHSDATEAIKWSDPPSAYSGQLCAGNDLGLGGETGRYENSADNWLRSPQISGFVAGDRTFLRFQRWLSVDHGDNAPAWEDIARIEVMSSGIIWKNHRYIPHVDAPTSSGQWLPFEIEITGAIPSEATTIQIGWNLKTDGNGQLLGGWNIDDVEVYSIRSVP